MKLLNVVNNASTTVFAVFNGGNAQLSGTLTQCSDRRLKTNILTLDASSSLAAINALQPVAYDWLDPEKGGVRQYGFIAQDVQQVFPNLVATTSATVCITKSQLAAMLAGSSQPSVQISSPTPGIISGTTTPPSITIQGSNPATINVGDIYTDLGAIVAAPPATTQLATTEESLSPRAL